VSNVLSEEKKQQVIALGRLEWSLRRIEKAAHIRRETAGAYLRAAGIAVRPPGGWGRNVAKPAIEVSTDSAAPKPPQHPGRSSTSACEPHREIVEAELAKGRNAMAIWQDLVDGHGFAGRYASVKWQPTWDRGHRRRLARPPRARHPCRLCQARDSRP
jgi:hypothetical protein